MTARTHRGNRNLALAAAAAVAMAACAAAAGGVSATGAGTGAGVSAGAAQRGPMPQASAPLVQPADFVYQGAFRMSGGTSAKDSFNFGSTALAWYPAHGTLLMVGHDWHQQVAEVEIPQPSGAASPDGLPVAALRQPLTDILEGRLATIAPDDNKIGGLLPWNDLVVVSAYNYYDAANRQTKSHFLSSMDFARRGDVTGPFRVGTTRPGLVAGYMTPIPAEWQTALGGPALTGQCCIPIITRTSFGPSASVFNPADLGLRDPVPATMLVGYPEDHPELGPCDAGSLVFNCTSAVAGVVFPPGTRSVLFFGRHGQGKFCYGDVGPGGCVDPAIEDKGPHAYPYVFQIWAYDAADLAAVRSGTRKPWSLRPYKVWTFELPFQVPTRDLTGVAYDPATRRVFIAAGTEGGGRIIHVYRLDIAAR